MVEELHLETYLWISPNEFRIYLFNKKNFNNLYFNKIVFDSKINYIDFDNLDKFLGDNIFKIEKLAGNFVKNISLIIENTETYQINFGIKKKNYKKIINKKFLENILIDAKELFRENYQNYYIMHLVINKYLIDHNSYEFYKEGLFGDYFCIELNFKSIPNSFVLSIDNVLEKFQIKSKRYLDGNYIKKFFKNENIDFSEMIFKIQNGCNDNEARLVPKNPINKGIFEKFFQLFS